MTEDVNHGPWAAQLEAVNAAFAAREAELRLQLQELAQQHISDQACVVALATARARIAELEAELAAATAAAVSLAEPAAGADQEQGKALQLSLAHGELQRSLQARDATLVEALRRASEDLHKLAAQAASERAGLQARHEHALAALQAAAAAGKAELAERLRHAEDEANKARGGLRDEAQLRTTQAAAAVTARNKLRLALTELWTQRLAFIELHAAWLAELPLPSAVPQAPASEELQRAQQALETLRGWVKRSRPDFDVELEARDAVASSSTMALAELISRDRLELQRAGIEVRGALQATLRAAQASAGQARDALAQALALLDERQRTLAQLESEYGAASADFDRQREAARAELASTRAQVAELETRCAALLARHDASRAADASARAESRLQRRRALLLARASRVERARQRQAARQEASLLREELDTWRRQAAVLREESLKLRGALDTTQARAEAFHGLAGELGQRLDAAQGLLEETSRLGMLRLPKRLRERIVRHLRGAKPPGLPRAAIEPDSTPTATMNSSSLTATGAAPKDLAALMTLPGPEFVRASYRALLGREPDPAGLAFYRARLREGVGRLQIVCELAASPEAVNKGRVLPGLAETLAGQQSRQASLRGRIGRLIASAINVGEQVRQQNRLEARLDDELLRMDRAIAALGDRLTRIEHGNGARGSAAPAPSTATPAPVVPVFSGLPDRTRAQPRPVGSPLERLDAATRAAEPRR
jgi:hypothetical protein